MARGDIDQGYIEEIIDAANAGDTSGFTRSDWQIIASNPGYETQRARMARETAERREVEQPDTDRNPYDPDAFARAQAEEFERRRVTNVVETLRGIMSQFGLSDLMNEITRMVQEGLDGDAVMARVRETEAYNQRFPAMKGLRSKGRVIDESAYIEFERDAARLERSYGLPAGILGRDAVTRLLENEVSARELEERVSMAATNSFQTPQEVKDQFERYYGIGPGGLTAYFLDPDKALPLLNKQYASAVLGGEGAMQGIGVGREMAEQLTEYGVTREQARLGFGRVRGQQAFTEGRGDVVTQDELIGANLMNQEDAQRRLERTAAARVGRFQRGGQYTTTQAGVAGLGSAASN